MSTQNLWTLYIEAPPAKVWAALTAVGVAQPFYFGSVLEAELKPGGKLRYRSKNGKATFIEGEVVELSPPHRFVHTFRFTDLDEPRGTVHFTLTPEKTGTRLTVQHDDLGAKHRARVTPGWTKILANTKAWVETGSVPASVRFSNAVMNLLAPLMPAKS